MRTGISEQKLLFILIDYRFFATISRSSDLYKFYKNMTLYIKEKMRDYCKIIFTTFQIKFEMSYFHT